MLACGSNPIISHPVSSRKILPYVPEGVHGGAGCEATAKEECGRRRGSERVLARRSLREQDRATVGEEQPKWPGSIRLRIWKLWDEANAYIPMATQTHPRRHEPPCAAWNLAS